ncbi:unnamed protein product [Discula destructiva]
MAPAGLVFGGATLASEHATPEQIRETLDILKENGVGKIDTAALYADSEECLGRAHAALDFAIDTKHPGGLPTPDPLISKRDKVIESAKQSLAKLQTNQVDIYYIHAPDRRIPFEDTLSGINEVYKNGGFRRFGLSNFLPAEVEQVVQICKDRDYVLPTVYQGSYSAIQRLMEVELLPVLRKHGICYYAYSPSAGGFLAKTLEQMQAGGAASSARWDPSSFLGSMYRKLFADKEATLASLGTWNEIAAAEGISNIDMAYRWVVHHSALDGALGDAVIFGALKENHLRGNLAAVSKGPLSEEAVARIGKIWEAVKAESHLDNFNGYIASLDMVQLQGRGQKDEAA